MARLWRVRVRPSSFIVVRRAADLPLLFAKGRQFAVRMIPKLRMLVRFPSPLSSEVQFTVVVVDKPVGESSPSSREYPAEGSRLGIPVGKSAGRVGQP